MWLHQTKKILYSKGNWLNRQPTEYEKTFENHPSDKLVSKVDKEVALTGVGQWVGRLLVKEKVTSLIPGQGTCLGCRPGSW